MKNALPLNSDNAVGFSKGDIEMFIRCLKLIRRTIGLIAALLLAVLSAEATPLAPTASHQAEFFPHQKAVVAEHTNAHFAARAPPMAVDNVAFTGAAVAGYGNGTVMHGDETHVASLGFGVGLDATNTADEVFTGARTLSRLDAEGWDLAEEFYEQMRRTGGGVDEIAQNSGLSRGAVDRAYRHFFLDQHQLDDGLRRFDADPEIVNAWNRMRNGTHTSADIDLVNHERFEAILMNRYGQPYRCAHAAANACGFQSPID